MVAFRSICNETTNGSIQARPQTLTTLDHTLTSVWHKHMRSITPFHGGQVMRLVILSDLSKLETTEEDSGQI
jgi:hypothetical protein